MMGTHQVSGMVDGSGEFFECKYKTFPNDTMEIVAPRDALIEAIDNAIGTIEYHEGQWVIRFKQLLAENGKVWDQIHSGNLNRFTLPGKLPPFTFFRIPATEAMGIGTRC